MYARETRAAFVGLECLTTSKIMPMYFTVSLQPKIPFQALRILTVHQSIKVLTELYLLVPWFNSHWILFSALVHKLRKNWNFPVSRNSSLTSSNHLSQQTAICSTTITNLVKLELRLKLTRKKQWKKSKAKSAACHLSFLCDQPQWPYRTSSPNLSSTSYHRSSYKVRLHLVDISLSKLIILCDSNPLRTSEWWPNLRCL